MPLAHQQGNRSAAAVQNLFSDAGHAVSPVGQDYGEDLIVQTQLDSEADDFQIYVQVKTVSDKDSVAGRPKVQVDLDHLRRWSNMVNPVLVCAYDRRRKVTYVVWPQHLMSRYELIASRRKTKTIRVGSDQIVDEHTVDRLVWRARIKYYSDTIALEESDIQEWSALGKPNEMLRGEEPAGIYIVTLKLAFELGVLEPDEVSQELRLHLHHFVATHETDDDILPALTLATLKYVEERHHIGLSFNILHWLPHTIGHAYIDMHPEEWAELSSTYPRQWKPFAPEPPR
jgi:hypothetical protein